MGTIGFSQGTGTLDTTSNLAYSLSGLNSSMGYDFYVRSLCGAGDKLLARSFNFNTLIQGPVGVNCTWWERGVIYLDDLESQGGWTGNCMVFASTDVNVNSGSTVLWNWP